MKIFTQNKLLIYENKHWLKNMNDDARARHFQVTTIVSWLSNLKFLSYNNATGERPNLDNRVSQS